MEPAMAATASSDFMKYLTLEKVKSIDMPVYDYQTSLRVWLKEFELQATFVGITDLDVCTIQLGRFMPTTIKNWLPTQAFEIRQSWQLLTEQLLLQFGKPADEEFREFKTQLRKCKQLPDASIRIHSAQWLHLLNFLPKNHLSDDQKIAQFTQSLYDRSLRSTIVAYVEIKEIKTVEEVIAKAIDIETKAKLVNSDENYHSTQHEVKAHAADDPMEVDYMHKQKQTTKKPFKQYRQSRPFKQSRPEDNLPRLYNKDGQPVCAHCSGIHRNYQCPQHQQSLRNVSVADTQSTSDITDERDIITIDTIEANPVHTLTTTTSFTPTTNISINNQLIQALWDTGSAITAIGESACKRLQLKINKTNIIAYSDVNNKVTNTIGTTTLEIFGVPVQFHIISGLARDMIIGWDLMMKWKVAINTLNKTITCHTNVKTVNVGYHTTASSTPQVHLTEQQTSKVHKVLDKYQDLFRKDDETPSITNKIQFRIDTGDHEPVYSKPRLYHPDLQAQIEHKFQELERNGIVSKVDFTEWGSPVTAVPKPDGSIRICGNYVKLNAITNTVKYPFVNMHHALQSLGKAKIFSKIDLISGYFQIPIFEPHKVKTALVTPNSTYVFNTMVMGTKNSPAYFQILMDKVLGPMRYTSAIAYQDDTILYSETFDQHLHDLKQLLNRFRDANLSINIRKCDFALTTIKFLGFLVTPEGIKADPDKVKPILQLTPPQDIKELERFIGMTGVYQKFISQYQVMIEPLRRLKRKNTPFVWEAEQEAAFQELKRQLAQLPLLKQPDFNLTFHLYCDAANTAGIAVVLCQHYNDTPYPLSFASRALTAAERNYTVRELEALAIVFGIQKHRMYLERRKFYVHTDHSSLQWLLNSNQDKQPRLWRWCLLLQSYDFEVLYIPGATNHVADALSRAINATDVTAQTINWSEEQKKDKNLALLLNNQNDKYKHYKVLNNVLYRIIPKPRDVSQNNIYKVVPSHLIPKILDIHHDSKFAGHGGITKTKNSLAHANLWWERMDVDITKHIQKCEICQHIKGHKNSNYQQHPTAGIQPFQKIAMDHFGPLPGTTNGYKYILVVIDTFTKYVEIYPSKTTNAMELANLVYNLYILRHGVPQVIMSDNGPPFGSVFMKELAQFTGIEMQHTPPHHPQSNGIVERYMSTLRQMLLIYANEKSIVGQWDQHLRIIRFVYNTMYHHSTTYSPFELTHGRHARTPLNSISEEHDPKKYQGQHTPQSKFAEDLKHRLDIAFHTVNEHIHQCKENHNNYRKYQQGDLVLSYNNALSTSAKSRKLSLDWLGPFTVTNVLSEHRYDIIHNNTQKKLNNVHVTMLKPYYK